MEESQRSPALLASDAEREQGITLLRDATVEGRLTLAEFSERVERAQLARTAADLQALIADLPAGTPSAAIAPAPAPVSPDATYRALCSRLVRRGPWELPARSSFRSYFGTIDLDLRQARMAGSPTEIDVHNLFGTVTLIVPEGIAVSVEGGGMFASQVVEPSSAPVRSDAPVLRIMLSGPGGTLYVRHDDPPGLIKRLLDR